MLCADLGLKRQASLADSRLNALRAFGRDPLLGEIVPADSAPCKSMMGSNLFTARPDQTAQWVQFAERSADKHGINFSRMGGTEVRPRIQD